MARKKLPAEVLEWFRQQGIKGGSLGGKAAAANMTPEQRQERAKKAVAAREAKRALEASPKPTSKKPARG